MGKKWFVLLVWTALVFYSCNNKSEKTGSEKMTDNAIIQQQDGTISLHVNSADTYQDVNEPESNTAEWNVVVSKSGRYNVWLSSATKDTTKLQYANAVMLSIKDDMLEVRPSIDKIIQNSSDVSYPYYRADSYVGSLYLKDTGVYSIQVVSDRILPENTNAGDPSGEETKLISVSLTPAE